MTRWTHPVLAFLALSACTSPTTPADPFEASGELIAFSGGEAGAGGACSTCHGNRGEGDGHLAPRLAGLDRGYAARQLENFASGARRHPQMEWIARRLSVDVRQKVAAYYAALPVATLGTSELTVSCKGARLYHEGAPRLGIASCVSCHGADGRGNAGNPALAGQSAAYLAHQLDAWATGERYGDPDGTMTAISRALHPADRQAVADYAAALLDDGGDRSSPATCLRTRRPGQPDGA